MTIKKIVRYCNEEGFEFRFEPIEDTLKITNEKDGYTAKYLIRDENSESPREWDNLGTMACWHKKYDLGDKIDFEKPDTMEELVKYLKEEKKAVIILPLYLYDHSGITIRTNRFDEDPSMWDTSLVGCIYVSKETIEKEKLNEDKAKEILIGEVKTYAQYLEGDCYCLVREQYDEKKNPIDYDTVGGCLGYEEAVKSLKTDI